MRLFIAIALAVACLPLDGAAIPLETKGHIHTLIQEADAVLVVTVTGRMNTTNMPTHALYRQCTVNSCLKGSVKAASVIRVLLRDPMPGFWGKTEWYPEGSVLLVMLKRLSPQTPRDPEFTIAGGVNSRIELSPVRLARLYGIVDELSGMRVELAVRRLLEFRIRLLSTMTLAEIERLSKEMEDLR